MIAKALSVYVTGFLFGIPERTRRLDWAGEEVETQMTYPDDVLKAAERVTALFRPVLTFREAERLRDDIAWEIMAERERCARIASRMEVGGIVETPELIPAILGQRERVTNG